MMKVSNLIKEKTDSRIDKDLQDCKGLFLFNYAGVPSAEITTLRRNLHGCGAQMFVTKNSFISVALKKLGRIDELSSFIDGPTALVFIKDDPIAPSKVLHDFSKAHESIKLRGGYLDERIVQENDFKVLASIPSREVLLTQVAIGLNAPVTKLARGLQQVITKVAYAIKAIVDKEGKGDSK